MAASIKGTPPLDLRKVILNLSKTRDREGQKIGTGSCHTYRLMPCWRSNAISTSKMDVPYGVWNAMMAWCDNCDYPMFGIEFSVGLLVGYYSNHSGSYWYKLYVYLHSHVWFISVQLSVNWAIDWLVFLIILSCLHYKPTSDIQVSKRCPGRAHLYSSKILLFIVFRRVLVWYDICSMF